MGIWSPMCWITSHDWYKKLETKDKIVEECRFCGAFREINKR